MLWELYEPFVIWGTFTKIGLVSMFGLIAFDQISQRKLAREAELLVGLTFVIAAMSYGFGWAAFFAGLMVFYMVVQRQRPAWLPGSSGQE